MRLGHQGQYTGIARGLAEGRAQIGNRGIGLIIRDQPDGAHLQRLDIGGILGNHLFHQRPRAHRIIGDSQHLRQNKLDPAGLVRGCGRGQNVLQGGNRQILLTRLEIDPGLERAVQIGIGGSGIGCNQPVQFGQGCGIIAGGAQELDQHDMAFDRIRSGPGQFAQNRLGPIKILLAHVPADQGCTDLFIVRKQLEHHLKCGPGRSHVARLLQQPDREDVKFDDIGFPCNRGLQQRQGGLRIGTLQGGINQDPAGHLIVGQQRQTGGGAGCRIGLARHVNRDRGRPVIQGRLEDLHVGLTRGQSDGRSAMPLGLFPVTTADRNPGQRHPDGQGIGILFDQAQILAVGLADLAARQLGVRVKLPGLQMKAVIFEHIAKLDQGPVDIAGLQQGQPGLVIALGLVLVAFTGGQ